MKYLIKIDDQLHGYDTLAILQIDLATNKPETYELFVRQDKGLTLKYNKTTLKQLTNKGENNEQ